jgi:ABC-type Zn uptake system ZnuABC Zn-binding protein ZnuA
VALGAVVLAATGCATSGGGTNGKPTVVATTTQIGDWARVVGGDAVSVHQILRPNTDPHEYEPRPDDVVRTANARVVFENGDGLDTWAAKLVSEGGGHPKVVVLGDAIPVTLPPHDPHWWHDAGNAEAAVRRIRDELAAVDPRHKRLFRARAGRYLARLGRLDSAIRACLRRVPRGERKLVTDHDAFDYFARRYGITVVGAVIPSQSTQAQPSAGEVARLIRLLRREHVRAIFPEQSLSARLARSVARETGASSGYALYGDTLGPAGSSGATYLEMEAANAEQIARGLTGDRIRCTIATR